jgi:hypothetical protein
MEVCLKQIWNSSRAGNFVKPEIIETSLAFLRNRLDIEEQRGLDNIEEPTEKSSMNH